jgi:hypothetical protein
VVAQMCVDASDPFRAFPLTKVVVNRRPGRQVFGQIALLAARAQ